MFGSAIFSDIQPVNVVCTSGLDEPVNGVTHYWTGVEKCDVYEGEVVLPRNGSDEPVNSVLFVLQGQMNR